MADELLDHRAAPDHLVLQPAGDRAARYNLQRTILNPVGRDEWAQYLPESDRIVLDREHPSGSVPMWGTTPGVNGGMRTRWNRMAVGDLVLFLAQNQAFLAATVTHKWMSTSLADALWERKEAGGLLLPWELMFSVTRPTPVSISYSELSAAADNGGPLNTRGFNVYSSPVSERVAGLLNVDERALVRTHSAVDFDEIVRTFDAVDAQATTVRRIEQSYLRDLILPAATGRCDLCSRQMDSAFLVAAHIKKRAHCSFEEKTDLPAIAMAACRFGCDELFERGIVWVDEEGMVRRPRNLEDDTARQYFDQHLAGRKLWRWDIRDDSHKYFAAHRSLHSRS